MRLSALSTEFVRVPIAGTENGSPADPTLGSALQVAVVLEGEEPVSGDWVTGTWETDPMTSPPTYYARVLIGPDGTLTLAKGTYDGWVRWTDNPEKPTLHALGFLHIF